MTDLNDEEDGLGTYSGSNGGDGVSDKEKRLTIIYFDVPGRAESLRMTAVISNVSSMGSVSCAALTAEWPANYLSRLVPDPFHKLGDKLCRLWLYVQTHGTSRPTTSF